MPWPSEIEQRPLIALGSPPMRNRRTVIHPTMISRIPYEILLMIFNKMTPKALCRFRQTRKWADLFVEENRFRISARFKQQFVLRAILYKRTKTMYFEVVRYRDFWAFSRSTYMEPGCFPFFDTPYTVLYPYQQLSAVHFESINISNYEFTDSNPKDAMVNSCYMVYFPIFEKLKLRSDNVLLHSLSPNHYKLLSLIQTNRIFLKYVNSAETTNLTLPNIQELFVGKIISQSISKLFSAYRSAGVSQAKTEDIFLLEEFLQGVRENKEARGNLTHFCFKIKPTEYHEMEAEKVAEEFSCFGMIPLKGFDGAPSFFKKIFKMNIDGGVAIITLHQEPIYPTISANPSYPRFDIYFLENYSRAVLFDFLFGLFDGIAPCYYLSQERQTFLNSLDEEEAVAKLYISWRLLLN